VKLVDESSKPAAGEGQGEEPLPILSERERWLDTMADMQSQSDRRYEGLSNRVTRLERKSAFVIPEEMRGFLLMLGLYIGVNLLLPTVIEMVERWRRHSDS